MLTSCICIELQRYINNQLSKCLQSEQVWTYFCFRKIMGEKVSNFPYYYYHYSFLGFIAPAKIQRDDVCRFSAKTLFRKNLAIPQSLTLQFAPNHVTYRCFTLPWDVGLYFMFPEQQESKIKVESYIYYKCFNFTIPFVTSIEVLKSSLNKDYL